MFPPLLLLALSACVSSVLAIHESMNFELGPSKRECFYEEVGINEEREIEVFVNSGGFLDITIFIYGPLPLEEVYAEKFESPVLLEEKIDAEKQSVSETQTFVHLFKPEVEGIFAVCLDNRNAKFITKLVEIDIREIIKTPIIVKRAHHESLTDKEDIESVQRSREAIEKIRRGLASIQEQQQRDRHRLGLHAETNSINENRMIVGSIIETSIFIFAALFQLYFVRNWFASRGGGPKQRV